MFAKATPFGLVMSKSWAETSKANTVLILGFSFCIREQGRAVLRFK
jgi:hypothetical protein